MGMQILVPGDPSLTVAMADSIVNFFEWVLVKDVSPAAQTRLRKVVVRYWKDPKQRPGFQQILRAEIQRQRADPIEQEATREQLAPQTIATLKALAKIDPDAAWLLTLPGKKPTMTAAPAAPIEKKLAPGDPPLTDLFVGDLIGFFKMVLKISFAPEQRAEFTRLLIAEWSDSATRQSALELIQIWRQRETIKPGDMPDLIRQQEIQLGKALPEAAKRSRTAAWLLSAYEAARKSRPDAPTAAERGSSGVVLVPSGGRLSARPALTQGRANYYIRHFSYLLETPLSAPQRTELQERLIAAWKRTDSDQMPGALEALQQWDSSIYDWDAASAWGSGSYRMPESLRQAGEKETIVRLRKQLADADARWVVRVYDDARRPLDLAVPEVTLPLCRSFATAIVFMTNEIQGYRAAELTEGFEKVIRKKVLAEAKKISPAQRARLALFPRDWAQVESDWEHLDSWGKEGLRAQWAALLVPYFPELKTMGQLRQKRYDAYQAAQKSDWDRLTAAQAEARFARETKRMEAQAKRDDRRFAMQDRMEMDRHATAMNIISNLGPGNWHYSVRY